ncbi:MAG TPA: hypothetical protein VNZ45_18610, partial [Bacteroidia bacterium]|nr:hypothetical protein [Bacteroidia bacterium]
MRKNILLLGVVSLIFSFNLSAQDWVNMMRNPNANVHDVQSAFYKWYGKKSKIDKDKGKLTAKKGEETEDESYELFKRWEWYNVPRADINGNRPNLNKVGTDYENYLKSSLTHNPPSNAHSAHRVSPSSGAWFYAGNTTVPTNSSSGNGGNGRVNRVRTFPGNANIMFACAASGGLWKTTNGGTTWATTTDQLGDLTTSDVVINPLKTNVMYLATGDGDGLQSIYPTPATIGVLKSSDGGATWVPTGLTYTLTFAGNNNYSVNELIMDPSDTSVLIAATSFGIYRTANSGATWTQTQAGWFHSVEFEPSHSAIVYAGASNLFAGGAKFYRSVNNGVAWTNIAAGLPSSAIAEGFDIGVTAADTSVVYVLADNTSTYDYNGLYRSTNHGVSFTKQSGSPTLPNVLGRAQSGNDYGVGQGWYDLCMSVSQTNRDSVWVGGINIWSSSNGGVNWTLNADWTGGGAPFVHADMHDIQFIPGTNSKGYVVGCDGGIFITLNSGTNWSNISNNIEIAQQYSVGPSQTIAGRWLTGWQDNGTNLSSSPWGQVLGGDGMVCFIDWSVPAQTTFYAENPQGQLSKSTNSGATWSSITTGITESGPWVTQWCQDPKVAATLYSGFQNVWKSTNGGGSWSKISTWGTGSITALAVDSSNTNFIYAAQSNMIQLTTNGGTTWTNITGTLPVVSASISAIAVSSKLPSHAWVTFSGYSGNEVYVTVNSGATWTNISAGLPTLPVNCIVSESGSPNGIYVGTDQGVYYHDTVTNAWTFFNTGLPLVMIGDLKIYQAG